ncbi:MAG: lysophospholipid acyltransferase family protein [Acidimicrobiales bacterium]
MSSGETAHDATDGDAETAPARSWDPAGIGRWQKPVKAVLRPIFDRLWHFDVSGLENVPSDGPAVLCPNHIAAIDSFFLPAVLSRGITYVGKAEYLDDWKTRRLFPALGMIPIDRRGGDHAASALDAARAVLEAGQLFGIYPEGTRSRSGKLHKGHTGAARLAIETGAPIIPVGLVGTAEVQPPGQSKPNFFRDVTIRIGEPVDVTRYAARIGDRAVYRQLIDEVMFEVQALCGQEYSNTYAGSGEAEPAEHTPERERPIDLRSLPGGADDGPTVPRRSSSDVLRARPLAEAG